MKNIENVSEKSAFFFLADELYFCLLHRDRHNTVRNAVQTYIEELFACFMIFQGNIEQKLRQHKSSVQGVLLVVFTTAVIIGPHLELGLLVTSVIAY